MNVEGKRVVVTGGTGSLGQVLVRRLLGGEFGRPERVVVFSRDEARQHAMRLRLLQVETATDEIIFDGARRCLAFRIGDVRDPSGLRAAIAGADIVINAAAMKQVPSCEYFPEEAYRTNVDGAVNLMNAVRETRDPPSVVVGVSTDKAVKPVNVMGMTKALQERLFIRANLDCPGTRFIAVRYGNVVASRGSVVPLFLDQIRRGGPITITDPGMTRFLMSLDDAVDTIAHAVRDAEPGEIFIPVAPSARMLDLARALDDRQPGTPVSITGIRPGEKLHEILVSEEEIPRTVRKGGYHAVRPMLPELCPAEHAVPEFSAEYSSADHLVGVEAIREMMRPGGRLGRALSDVEAQGGVVA